MIKIFVVTPSTWPHSSQHPLSIIIFIAVIGDQEFINCRCTQIACVHFNGITNMCDFIVCGILLSIIFNSHIRCVITYESHACVYESRKVTSANWMSLCSVCLFISILPWPPHKNWLILSYGVSVCVWMRCGLTFDYSSCHLHVTKFIHHTTGIVGRFIRPQRRLLSPSSSPPSIVLFLLHWLISKLPPTCHCSLSNWPNTHKENVGDESGRRRLANKGKWIQCRSI